MEHHQLHHLDLEVGDVLRLRAQCLRDFSCPGTEHFLDGGRELGFAGCDSQALVLHGNFEHGQLVGGRADDDGDAWEIPLLQ